jgi:chromosome segregation ATPase
MREQKGRGLRILGGLLLVAAMLAMAAAVTYFALDDHSNRSSAEKWRARSIELRHVLDARDTQLIQRTQALTVASSQLGQLGGQVGTLDQRTRTLASEKAQIEDQRALLQSRSDALTKVAQQETDCSSGLSQAISHVAAQDSIWLSINGPGIDQTCQQAQNELNAFNTKYG